MATKYEIKKLIDSMAEVVRRIGVETGLQKSSDAGLDKIAKFELAQFLMYLSASDGKISWSEAKMISDLCDLELTPQTVGDFIRENNIYSTEFEEKVPVSIQLFVTMDNKFVEMGMQDEVSDVFDTVIDTYNYAADFLIKSDGDEDYMEDSDRDIYINMLKDYVNNNSSRRKKSATGFTKNSGNISVPTKSGVSAPKKKG